MHIYQEIFKELKYCCFPYYGGRKTDYETCLGVHVFEDTNLFGLGIEIATALIKRNIDLSILDTECYKDVVDHQYIIYFPNIKFEG